MKRFAVVTIAVLATTFALPAATSAASAAPTAPASGQPSAASLHLSLLSGPTGVCEQFTPSPRIVGGVILRIGPPAAPTGPGFLERDVDGLLAARLAPNHVYSVFLADITVVDGVPSGCAANSLGTVTTNGAGLLLFRVHAPGTFTFGTLQMIVTAGPAFALTGWASNFMSIADICAAFARNPLPGGIGCLPGGSGRAT